MASARSRSLINSYRAVPGQSSMLPLGTALFILNDSAIFGYNPILSNII
jgi:hypothetical protein